MIIPLAMVMGSLIQTKTLPIDWRFSNAEERFRRQLEAGDRYLLSTPPPDYPADYDWSKQFEDIALKAGKTPIALKAWTLSLVTTKHNLARENKLIDQILACKVPSEDSITFVTYWGRLISGRASEFPSRDRLPKVFDPYLQGSKSKASTASILFLKATTMSDVVDLKWDVYNRLVEQYPGTDGAKQARLILLKKKNLQRGDEFPDFISKDSDGKKFQLTELRGKVVVMEFWANWCPSCQRTIPVMQGVEKTFAGKPVEFIGINSDGDSPVVKELQAKWGMTTRTLVDGSPTGPISTRYAIMAWPSFFVIGKDGKVVYRSAGIDAEGLTAAINEVSK